MRLIDVAAILDVETSIKEGKEFSASTPVLEEFYGPDLAEKKYAILSHCWGVEKQGEKEVSYKEMKKLLFIGEGKRKEIRGRTGYKKIVDTCKQAQKDDLKWAWIDTCCIDKTSSSELSEAINSMYQWYENATSCYVYLHDTAGNSWTNRRDSPTIPKWFTRGWTLQELVAPKVVHFFDQRWEPIGDRTQLADILSEITRIPQHILKNEPDFERPGVAQIMSWAADRTTTREEDRAYSLLGLLGVHMPLLYGEGKNAFRRLQLEIIRTSNPSTLTVVEDPSSFRDCDQVWLSSPSGVVKENMIPFPGEEPCEFAEEEPREIGRAHV